MNEPEGEEPRACCGSCKVSICVAVVAVIIIVFSVFSVASTGYTTTRDGYAGNDDAKRYHVQITYFWINIPLIIGWILLIVAASLLLAAIFCFNSGERGTAKVLVLVFMIYDLCWAIIACVVSIVGGVLVLLAVQALSKDKRYRNVIDQEFTTMVTAAVIVIILYTLGIFACFIGCLVPVYQYYDYIRPMAVIPRQNYQSRPV